MQLLAKLFKVLNSEASPWQIAFAIMCGLIIGLTPLWRIHNLLILLIVLSFRMNLSGFILSWVVFSGVAYVFDPLMIHIGEAILTAETFTTLGTALYASSLGQMSQFNHTLTMGSLIVSLTLAPIVLLLSRYLVIGYRQKIMKWVEKLKIVQLFKASRLHRIYTQLGD
ncbi:TIGR03546 family protein [Alteromonadaceae bacterium BrNp21-10]|nr:TIGR03546 family protein [Alteromonadaceae bacterium BrNp21-10]